MRKKYNLKELSVDELKILSSELIELTEKELLAITRMISFKSQKRRLKFKKFKLLKVTKQTYRFAPDAGLKTIFLLLDPILILEIISELLGMEFEENMKITPLNTEHYHILDKISKSHVRGDLAFKISGINGNEEITVVIELQSRKDDTMGFRMFVYSINLAKQTEDEGKKVYEFPKGITIYTTDEIKDDKGFDEVYFKLDDFSVQGFDSKKTGSEKSSVRELQYDAKEGDLLKVNFPYVNLFKMKLDDICSSALYVFSAVYLYKYRKKPELIQGMDVEDIVNKINQSVAKYKGKNKEALQKIASDCFLDFLDILNSDKKRFEKELKQVSVLTRTPTDMLIEKAIRKTEEKAEKVIRKAEEKAYQEKVNMVVEMINQNCVNEFIQTITKMSIEEIKKIREEHSKQ